MTGKKILLVANTAWYLYNFRLPLARRLRDLGSEVVFVSPPDQYVERLKAEGFRWVEFKLNRRSINPLAEALALARLAKIYRQERPTACHHFTIKCVLYGTIAAKLAGIKSVVNAVTGLGHMFLGNGLAIRVLRPMVRFIYRKILTARRVQVIFQNGDDLAEFAQRDLVAPDKVTIIRGSGVNLTRFRPRPGPVDGAPSPMVLFASRFLREKGLIEFVEAARMLKSKGIEANFALAGKPDPGNPSSISDQEIESWTREGIVDVLGHLDNIEELLHLSTLVVLPSYREGTPRILLEAAAVGKPIVATDVPGCREIVKDGVNGLLVPAKDAGALADAMEKLLKNPDMREDFRRNAKAVVADFEETKVIQATIEVYRKCELALMPMN